MQRHLLTLAALAVCSPSFMLAADGSGGPGNACLNTYGLPKWQSHKNVWAGKITGIVGEPGVDEKPHTVVVAAPDGATDSVAIRVGEEWFARHKPELGGYFVLYQDGYRSYSPAEAFEQGNTPAYVLGDHQGKIAWQAWLKTLEGHPAAEGAPTWETMITEEGGVIGRAWNRAAAAVSATVMSNLREYSGPEPAKDPALDLGVNEISNLIHLFEDAGSGYRVLKHGEDISAPVAVSLRAILATLGRDVVGYPTPGTIEPKKEAGNSGDVSGATLSHSVDGVPVMRARLLVISVGPTPTSEGAAQEIEMMAVGPDGTYPETGLDPDSTFSKWTPSANLKMAIANPNLFDAIARGDKFAVEFVRIHRDPAAEPIEKQAPPAGHIDVPPNGEPATITHLAAKDPGGNDVPTPQGNAPKPSPADAQPGGEPAPQNDDVPAGGPVPTPETAEAAKS